MLVARNKDNSLYLTNGKFLRDTDRWYLESHHDSLMQLDENEFPKLKWEDEPLEVRIVSKDYADYTMSLIMKFLNENKLN